jgi:hypothetical protein
MYRDPVHVVVKLNRIGVTFFVKRAFRHRNVTADAPGRGTVRCGARSTDMKLLIGAVAYLSVAAAVVAAVFVGALSLSLQGPEQPPVLAKGTDGRSTGWERAREEAMRDDPNRVPVWIAPTAKYQYTPAPADQTPRHSRIIGHDARGAMAKGAARPRPEQVEAARPRMQDSRRDNDPFFRD